MKEKCELLNELMKPFGYSYILSQDIFTSHANTWPLKADPHAGFNQTVSFPGMVSDTLPVYFDYADKTWLIAFRKGQYGIHTGGEIGVYCADRLPNKQEQKPTRLQSTAKDSLLKLSFSYYEKENKTAQLSAKCDRLALLKMGSFFLPSDLSMQISLSFPSYEMARVFAEGLVDTGYRCDDVCICQHTVRFTFGESVLVRNPFRRLHSRILQYRNYFLCRIYCFLTRPFRLSVDKVLYLHYYLPFMLHKIRKKTFV